MPTIIPVKFAYAARDLWFDPKGTQAQEGDHVICSTERGTEIGLATEDAREVSREELEQTVNGAQLRPVLRIATDEDLARAEELVRRGEEAMPDFRRHVSESGLDMKPVGVEYLFDGEKAVFYFAAVERVDFRQLVRDLSREFHVRIDMRQIGVREEAALVGGYGHCGQELCCRRFNMSFDPVSIRMAKEQDLPLNNTKISGACGRLMCCLRYEFEAYRDFKTRAPKRNAVIDTPLGKGKIVEYDTPKEQICLRLESGKQVRIPLADMTCSEAAHKKSEELGCPCRPDTVTRDVLERLESPDVQMALAELDRKNGVAPDPAPDASDIFVSTKRKRRRPSNGAPSGSGSGERGERPQRDASRQQSEASEGTPRRRRNRRGAEGDAARTAPEAQQAAPQPSRRRRHHTVEGDAAQGRPQAGSQAQPGDEQRDDSRQQRRSRTRRPGDKGGMQPSRRNRQRQDGQDQRQGQGQDQPRESARPGRGQRQNQQRRGGDGQGQQRPGRGQQGQGQQRPQSDAGDGQPKPRRRRRRGGRGHGGEGQGGQGQAPSAQ